jgi:hypothetical protein
VSFFFASFHDFFFLKKKTKKMKLTQAVKDVFLREEQWDKEFSRAIQKEDEFEAEHLMKGIKDIQKYWFWFWKSKEPSSMFIFDLFLKRGADPNLRVLKSGGERQGWDFTKYMFLKSSMKTFKLNFLS